MKISTFIVIAAAVLTLVVTGISFIVLGVSRSRVNSVQRLSEADLILNNADRYLRDKDMDRAVTACVSCFDICTVDAEPRRESSTVVRFSACRSRINSARLCPSTKSIA